MLFVCYEAGRMIFDFIERYFINAIWERSGYNPYNTTVYAFIGLLSIYLLYRLIKRYMKSVDERLLYYVMPYVLLGSTVRVITDCIDTGVISTYISTHNNLISNVYNLLLASHLYDYGYLTVTPGIYILTATVFLSVFVITHRIGNPKLTPVIGYLLWFPHLFILIPLITYPVYLVIILTIAGLGSLIGYLLLKRLSIPTVYLWVIFAHLLDGSATFTSIELFNRWEPICNSLGRCYSEQHVLSSVIGDRFGYHVFLLFKFLLSFLIVYYLNKDRSLSKDEKIYLLVVLTVIGLAPGIRDTLRLITGG